MKNKEHNSSKVEQMNNISNKRDETDKRNEARQTRWNKQSEATQVEAEMRDFSNKDMSEFERATRIKKLQVGGRPAGRPAVVCFTLSVSPCLFLVVCSSLSVRVQFVCFRPSVSPCLFHAVCFPCLFHLACFTLSVSPCLFVLVLSVWSTLSASRKIHDR